MKCTKARELLSDRHNGEISPRAAAGLRRHLKGCEACREATGELEEMLQMLGSWSSPALPDGFDEAVHERLSAQGQGQSLEAAPASAVSRPMWSSVVRGGGLVAAGAAAVLLIVWVTSTSNSTPAPATRILCPAPGHAKRATTMAPGIGVAARPPDSARRLRVGQVAVLVLSIRAEARQSDARLLVVLPDGVTLVGEGARDLEEKRMEWTASLDRGVNEIRVPVRARRVGTWRLVARARASGFRTVSETRLVVTRS